MAEIKLNTGVVDYDLAGKVTVSFNPTDMMFGKKLGDAIDKLIEIHERPKAEGADTKAIFEEILSRDAEARGIIDDLFGKEVCAPLFGTLSVFAIADGFPLWAGLLASIVDEMDASADKAVADMQKRISKYTNKYTKKYHK